MRHLCFRLCLDAGGFYYNLKCIRRVLLRLAFVHSLAAAFLPALLSAALCLAPATENQCTTAI